MNVTTIFGLFLAQIRAELTPGMSAILIMSAALTGLIIVVAYTIHHMPMGGIHFTNSQRRQIREMSKKKDKFRFTYNDRGYRSGYDNF